MATAAVAQQEEDYEQEEVEDRENAADNMEDDIEDEVEEGVNGFEADLLEVLEDAQPGQLATKTLFSIFPKYFNEHEHVYTVSIQFSVQSFRN